VDAERQLNQMLTELKGADNAHRLP
jgi:hypothetical protein